MCVYVSNTMTATTLHHHHHLKQQITIKILKCEEGVGSVTQKGNAGL